MIEQLAGEYASQNVVFLEYDVDAAPMSRISRFFTGLGGGSASLPLVMTDSGTQIHQGYNNHQYNQLKAMVDASLARPSLADISAVWARSGSRVTFTVTLTNRSGGALSANANDASVHAIVYEDTQGNYTSRWVRAAVSKSITSLGNGATGSYTLETGDLTGVDWSKLHFIVLADYTPGGDGPYDMLQAAVAQTLSVAPDEMRFVVDPDDTSAISQAASVILPSGASWSASAPAWISVSPTTGTASTQPVITVNRQMLVSGWQTGAVTFTSGGVPFDTLAVSAFLGETQRLYLPLTLR